MPARLEPLKEPTDPLIRSVAFTDADRGWLLFEGGSALHTEDAGKSWSTVTLPQPFQAMHFSTATAGWAWTAQALFRTLDGGLSWELFDTSKWPALGFSFFLDDHHFWTANREATWATQDGGRTWWQIMNPCPPDSRHPMSFINASTGWLMCGFQEGAGFESKRLYRTDDSGRTWRLLAEALRGPDGKPSDGKDSPGGLPIGDYVGDLAFGDERHGWLSGVRYGSLLATEDGGVTWHGLDSPVSHAGQLVVVSPSILYDVGITQRGWALMGSRDAGKTWTQLYPKETTQSRDPWLVVDAETAFAAGVVGNSKALLLSRDLGRTWEVVGTLPTATVQALSFLNQRMGWALAGSQLYRTVDGGQKWGIIGQAPDGAHQLQFLDEQNGFIANDKLYVTQDGGKTWVAREAPPAHHAVQWETAAPAAVWRLHDFVIEKSTDAGVTWAGVPLDPQLKPQSIAVVNKDQIWIAGGQCTSALADSCIPALLFTDNSGRTWTQLDLGVTKPNHVWAGRDGTVWLDGDWGSHLYVSRDSGHSWTQLR